MGGIRVHVHACFLVLLLAAGHVHASTMARALFGFGDSYVDIGNRAKQGPFKASSWNKPYGITWPGYPTGRFSNGKIQTDYLAEFLGLPSPTAYVNSAVQDTSFGIDYAVGGSGVTYAYGLTPVGTQVDQFELTLQTGLYSSSFLAESIALMSVVGNDYAAANYTAQELLGVIEQVVEGIALSLKRLYTLGLKSVLVPNLPPIGCLPAQTYFNNNTACLASTEFAVLYHNSLLSTEVTQLNKLPGANFEILDQFSSFQYIRNNSAAFDVNEIFAPCCKRVNASFNCGDVDKDGNLMYTLCKDPARYFFWDNVHPTEATWENVYSLYRKGYALRSGTLEHWLQQTVISWASAPAPSPCVPESYEGAVRELEEVYDALLSKSDYSEALGLLQAVNIEGFLADVAAEKVTVFLPNNAAFSSLSSDVINFIYAKDQVLTYVAYHAVFGYHNSSQLSTYSEELITLSGLDYTANSTQSGLYIGQKLDAKVIAPDLVNSAGQVVVHGIDKLLIPPTV